MGPPKVKLHKFTGKTPPGPSKQAQPQTVIDLQPDTSSSESNLSDEQEQQFQTELYWCIKQLQSALSSDKLGSKQMQEHTKALNILMSHSAPMIKKRQVMRLSFGDYRAKMAEQEKKAKKVSIKVETGKPSEKSVFLKKAFSGSSGSDFKFNFQLSEKTDGISNEVNALKQVSLDPADKRFAFKKSDNTFRFNFASEAENKTHLS